MRVILAGGGTGGHLMPGLALASALQRRARGTEILFIGTRRGLDRQLVPASGWRLALIAAGRGSPLSLRRPLNAPRFLWSLLQSRRRLRAERADCVVALGGFAAAAPGLAAGALGVPLVLLEQNTVPGRVTRLLAPRAREVHLQFGEAAAMLPGASGRISVTGSPLREEVRRLTEEPPVHGGALLVVGGSQGARDLNRLVLAAGRPLAEAAGGRVIHIAGPAHVEEVRAGWSGLGIDAEVYGFATTMPALYRRSSVVVSRAGALSLAEFAAAGLPAVLVPLPTAKDDHQRTNAASVAEAGAAVVLEPAGLRPEALAGAVADLFGDDATRAALADGMRGLARPDAADRVAARILALADGGG
jgi:UDP-N-acetylglucosamine--N-acetylmuramyl-(pentapeptide) pyrophosphoryl-undecaprenol N-acetylglucosamine transferase